MKVGRGISIESRMAPALLGCLLDFLNNSEKHIKSVSLFPDVQVFAPINLTNQGFHEGPFSTVSTGAKQCNLSCILNC